MSAPAPSRIFDVVSLVRRGAGGMTAVLACYLDDSDAHTSNIVTVAGYVAEDSSWKRFGPLAEEICRHFKVDVIHGREFDGRKGCFKGWTMPRSISFLDTIGAALAQCALFGISRSILKDHYKARKSQVRLNPNLSAYGFAFGTIVFGLRNESLGVSDRVAEEGVAYLVESGHQNNPDLERYIHSEVAHGNLHKDTSISFIGKQSCRAVQIADLYAFYSRRRANKYHKSRGRLAFFPDIYKMHIQSKLPHYSGLIEEPYTEATNTRTGEVSSL